MSYSQGQERPIYKYLQEAEFESLVGKTISKIRGLEPNSTRLTLYEKGTEKAYGMENIPNCYEEVYIKQIEGDIDDLIDAEILEAECFISFKGSEYCSPEKWTFYKLRTSKGYITITWVGDSQYYSTNVDFYTTNAEQRARYTKECINERAAMIWSTED